MEELEELEYGQLSTALEIQILRASLGTTESLKS